MNPSLVRCSKWRLSLCSSFEDDRTRVFSWKQLTRRSCFSQQNWRFFWSSYIPKDSEFTELFSSACVIEWRYPCKESIVPVKLGDRQLKENLHIKEPLQARCKVSMFQILESKNLRRNPVFIRCTRFRRKTSKDCTRDTSRGTIMTTHKSFLT
jgi:hypothetical protein